MYGELKDGLREDQKERKRLEEEVDRLRKKNESLNRRVDELKLKADVSQVSPSHMHTGTSSTIIFCRVVIHSHNKYSACRNGKINDISFIVYSG